jgi:hypothetical protein
MAGWLAGVGIFWVFILCFAVLFMPEHYTSYVPEFYQTGIRAIFLVAMGATGLGLGVAQWSRLRRIHAPTWIWASALGGLIGSIVALSWMQMAGYSRPLESVTYQVSPKDVLRFAVMGMALAAPIALPQWLILRRQVAHSGWWALASVGSSALGWAMVPLLSPVGFPGREYSFMSMLHIPVFSLAVVAAVYAIATGVTMLRLLRHPLPQAPSVMPETPPQAA